MEDTTMCTFIGIEVLAANALIEILGKTGKREVDFETLVKYGMKVVEYLQEKSGEKAILLLSKKYQLDMVENYSNFFDVELEVPGRGIFRLKENVTIDDLSDYFRWTLSVKTIKAFMSEEVIMELGIAA